MEADQVQPGSRHQRRQPLHELQRRHHNAGGAVAPGGLKPPHHLPDAWAEGNPAGTRRDLQRPERAGLIRIGLDEYRPAISAPVHAVQHQAVQVDVEKIGRRPKALDQRDRAAVGFVGLEAGLLMRRPPSRESGVGNDRGGCQLHVDDRLEGPSNPVKIAQNAWWQRRVWRPMNNV